MAYSYQEIKTFLGLFAQANSFNIPQGAMEIAKNIVINDDNVITKTRGFYQYFAPALADTISNLFFYQNRLMAVYNDFISYFTDTGSSPSVTGSETALTGASFAITTSSRKSRSVQQNANLYWTTDDGVFKLDRFNGTVIAAGASPALDIRGNLFSANGPILGDTQFAVRAVFGRKDANGNVTLGAPSDILLLTNQPVVGASYTSSGAGPYTVTVTSNGHNLATGMTIEVDNATDADADGTKTITVTGVNTFTFSTVADPTSGTLDYSATRAAIYWFSIPTDITSTTQSWFYQVYRTSQSGDATISPTADFRLIDEVLLTSAEITAGFVTYVDEVDEILVEFAPELYTNPNSREGEFQANYRPPLCEDMTLFNSYVFYGNCISREFVDLDVVDTASLVSGDYVETNVLPFDEGAESEGITNAAGDLQIDYDGHGLSNGDTIYISDIVGGSLTAGTYYVVNSATNEFEISLTSGGSSVLYSAVTSLRFAETTVRRYVARTGVGNRTVESEGITNTAGNLQIDYVAHGLLNGDTVYISTVTGGSLTAGTYYVVNRAANSFEISLTSGGAAIAHSAVTSLYFEGVTNGTYPIFQLDDTPIPPSSIATQLRNTAQGLVKAINRDDFSLIFANYTSGITDTPGKMRFTSKGFTGPVYLRANTTTAGDAFYPILPASFVTGNQVFSSNDEEPNVVYISKIGEPEAVPLINKLPVGSKNAAILRVVALRNAVIVLKEDGVFKITGDNPINFTVTLLDNTVSVIASDSVATLNNQIYFLSTDGICIATDSTVSIVSRRIENRIETIVGFSDINAITSAVGYDSDRTYRISTALPNDDTKSIAYFHNVINDTWTESDELFSGGVVGPNNTMFYIATDNRILKERKLGTRIDYSRQNYAVTITSVASNGLSAVIASPSGVPDVGYFIVKNDVITRIKTVSVVSGSNYAVTFYRPTNLVAADVVQMYQRIVSEIKMAPFHAGILERGKQFSQLQLHTRNPSITEIGITFTGQTFGGSEQTNWVATDVAGASGGWGFEPWGFFPWGLADGIDIVYLTQPALVIRLYVPLFQQRGTFIQPYLVHNQGGESIDIQAMSWALRAYAERVTK